MAVRMLPVDLRIGTSRDPDPAVHVDAILSMTLAKGLLRRSMSGRARRRCGCRRCGPRRPRRPSTSSSANPARAAGGPGASGTCERGTDDERSRQRIRALEVPCVGRRIARPRDAIADAAEDPLVPSLVLVIALVRAQVRLLPIGRHRVEGGGVARRLPGTLVEPRAEVTWLEVRARRRGWPLGEHVHVEDVVVVLEALPRLLVGVGQVRSPIEAVHLVLDASAVVCEGEPGGGFGPGLRELLGARREDGASLCEGGADL